MILTTLLGKIKETYHTWATPVIKEQRERRVLAHSTEDGFGCTCPGSPRLRRVSCSEPLQVLVHSPVDNLSPFCTHLFRARRVCFVSEVLRVCLPLAWNCLPSPKLFKSGRYLSLVPSLKNSFCGLKLERTFTSSKRLAEEVSGWESCSRCLQNAIDEHAFPPEPLSCYQVEAGLFRWCVLTSPLLKPTHSVPPGLKTIRTN